MEAFGASIISGIIGGLLTSLILLIAAVLWRDRFLPWIEDRIYRGIRIEGTWGLIDKNDDRGDSLYSQEETLELEQKAARLTGRMILVSKDGEEGKARTLTVEGAIRDRFLMISCIPSTRRHLGYQTFLGEISGDGSSIKGQASYYHTDDTEVKAIEATYTRRNVT